MRTSVIHNTPLSLFEIKERNHRPTRAHDVAIAHHHKARHPQLHKKSSSQQRLLESPKGLPLTPREYHSALGIIFIQGLRCNRMREQALTASYESSGVS